MTKRFTLDETFMITDNECMEIINPLMNSKDVATVCDKLNELVEENQHLESHLEMVREQRDKEMEKSKALKKQLDSEHQMLENAILLERTRMGQNSLKQYKEAIQ